MITCVLKQILHKKKNHFHPTNRIPNSSFYCCWGDADPSGWSFATTKRAWKMHFWYPSQWDVCVLNIKESNFNGKMVQNFHVCLRSGSWWLNPPHTHCSRARIKYQPKNDYMETWTFFYLRRLFLPGYHITLYHVSGSQGRPCFSQFDFRSALIKFPWSHWKCYRYIFPKKWALLEHCAPSTVHYSPVRAEMN